MLPRYRGWEPQCSPIISGWRPALVEMLPRYRGLGGRTYRR